MTEVTFTMVQGPNNHQLLASLGRPYKAPMGIDPSIATAVTFTDDTGTEFLVCIDSMGREDSSGNSWTIEGRAVGPQKNHGQFVGYYQANSRKGWLRFALYDGQ